MKLDRLKKLSFRSYLSIVLTIFSTTLLIEYFTISSQTKLMIEEAQKRASENVFGFAKIIINPMLEKDYSDIVDIFNAIVENKKIVQISLLDTDGISKITVKNDGKALFDKKKYDVLISNKYDEHAHLITSVAPISNVGFLMIQTSTIETEKITENAIFSAVVIAVILVVVAILFNIVLLKKPLKELEQLSDFATTIPFNYGLNAPETNSTLELKALSAAMTDASHQIYEQKSELEAMNSELSAMNEGLRDMVDEQTQKIMEHERLLVQQSKMAAMGDMIGAIAHQWRQPLNALAIAIQDIKFAHESGELDDVYIANTVKSSMGMINFMSGTIEDFRNFFKPGKEKGYFSAVSVVKSVLSILGTQLESHDIKLTVEGGDFKIFGYAGELSQVVLNLISNSKDAILGKKERADEWIRIHIDSGGVISICDSGGGIAEDILGRIFEPYFTTKEQGKGTGIGLYMSKLIVEKHMDGFLAVENSQDGACFKIGLSFSENKM